MGYPWKFEIIKAWNASLIVPCTVGNSKKQIPINNTPSVIPVKVRLMLITWIQWYAWGNINGFRTFPLVQGLMQNLALSTFHIIVHRNWLHKILHKQKHKFDVASSHHVCFLHFGLYKSSNESGNFALVPTQWVHYVYYNSSTPVGSQTIQLFWYYILTSGTHERLVGENIPTPLLSPAHLWLLASVAPRVLCYWACSGSQHPPSSWSGPE